MSFVSLLFFLPFFSGKKDHPRLKICHPGIVPSIGGRKVFMTIIRLDLLCFGKFAKFLEENRNNFGDLFDLNYRHKKWKISIFLLNKGCPKMSKKKQPTKLSVYKVKGQRRMPE